MSHEHADTCCHGHGHGHDHGHRHAPRPAVAAIGTLAGNAELRWSDLRIEAMDCPTEERLIRDALGRQPAVESLEFNLMQRLLRVQHRFDSVEPLQKLIAGLGMQAVPLDAGENTDGPSQAPAKPWWPLALAGAMALASEIVEWFGLAPDWVVAGLALLAILGAGLPTYRKGWIALKNRNLNINALMSIAVTGAVLIGQWPEAAMVSVLFAIAELIEAKSLDRARNAIRGLLQLAPEQATVLVGGEWKELPAKQVELEATVRVKPGERIALDGEVTSGRSSVNQAPITGESLPVEKEVGEPVFAGSINGEGALEYRVTRRADDSTLARIIHAVEEAQGSRAPTQRFVDSFARVYTPVVFLIALATAVLPPLLFGGAWLDWIYRALVLLVIACPCALVISTPVTIVSGLSAAARLGILIKGGCSSNSGASCPGSPSTRPAPSPMANRNRPTTCRSRRLTGRMRACSPPAWPRVPTTRYRAPWPTQRKRTALPWAWSRTSPPCRDEASADASTASSTTSATIAWWRNWASARRPWKSAWTPWSARARRSSRCAIRSACGPSSPSPTGSRTAAARRSASCTRWT